MPPALSEFLYVAQLSAIGMIPMAKTELLIDKIESEMGQIWLVSEGETLVALDFADYESRLMKLLEKRYASVSLIAQAKQSRFGDRLCAYLAGELNSLDEIPVNPGGTPFQHQVWLTLRSIPPGTVMTYGELAQKIGKPTAQRAVGMTNSLNPIAIVLPCHRVIGANGKLTGYAGGLERKQWLLKHEGIFL
jgi:methylated-DNA-[protein]-cysteine S-methyltransferase